MECGLLLPSHDAQECMFLKNVSTSRLGGQEVRRQLIAPKKEYMARLQWLQWLSRTFTNTRHGILVTTRSLNHGRARWRWLLECRDVVCPPPVLDAHTWSFVCDLSRRHVQGKVVWSAVCSSLYSALKWTTCTPPIITPTFWAIPWICS